MDGVIAEFTDHSKNKTITKKLALATAAGAMIGIAAGFVVSPWFGIGTGSVSYAAMTSGALAQRNRAFSVSEIRLSGEQSTQSVYLLHSQEARRIAEAINAA